MDWKLYVKTYLPLVYKMADFNHTAISRLAAANIIAATVNEAAEKHFVSDSILNAFFTLGQDTDLIIRKAMLKNYHALIPVAKDKYLEDKLFSEVNLTRNSQLVGMLKEANSSSRTLITELVIKNARYFDKSKIVDEFLPLFISEVESCYDFSEDWVIANFALVTEFLLNVADSCHSGYTESVQKYWQVLLASPVARHCLRQARHTQTSRSVYTFAG